jgi:hypothetical protein
MAWQMALATVPATLIGFLAGLLSFHVKQRWCPVCGAALTCPDPTYHPPCRAAERTETRQ